MIIKRNLGRLSLSVLMLTAFACSENESLSEDFEPLERVEASLAVVADNCGNNVFRRSLGSAAAVQGNRCTDSSISLTEDNPGGLDCRALNQGSHTREGSWFLYNIVQGFKDANNGTAVRIERAFANFNNPPSGMQRMMAFNGRVRVDRLPNDPSINSPRNNRGPRDEFREDFTYVCQMHGSREVRNIPGSTTAQNGQTHNSAIWLLRAQRVNNTNRFRFVLEMSNGPFTSSNRPGRTEFDLGGDRLIGTMYRIRVDYGFVNRCYQGTIRINSEVFNLEDIRPYNFTTQDQYFRYGAYRAGRNITGNANATPNFAQQAIVAWEDNTTYCIGPITAATPK